LFEQILVKCSRIYLEPKKKIINLGEIYDPSAIGIPVESMCKTTVSTERIMNSIHASCTPLPAPNAPFQKRINVAIPVYEAELYRNFFALVNMNMNLLRTQFINAWTYVICGGVPHRVPPILNDLKRIHPITDPFNMNPMFENLPMGLQFSYGLICELDRWVRRPHRAELNEQIAQVEADFVVDRNRLAAAHPEAQGDQHLEPAVAARTAALTRLYQNHRQLLVEARRAQLQDQPKGVTHYLQYGAQFGEEQIMIDARELDFGYRKLTYNGVVSRIPLYVIS
jgi:hypothetical protein